MNFDYHKAFTRNLGWVAPEEQEILRNSRIAIAGLGGVGGIYLMTLARLGIGKFNLAEYDTFELTNFNRQAGAFLSTIGQPKIEVMVKEALDINSELDLRLFPKGLTQENADEFLKDVDLYVDGLDFFAIQARELIFNKCAELGIPAITSAPIGMSAALLTYMPGGLTFEEYFQFKGLSETDKLVHFLAGLSPRMLHRHSIYAPQYFDLANRRTGSLPIGCDLCAGFLGTYVLKILLKRGKIYSLPYALQFEAYQNKLVKTWRPWGNKNPLNRIIIKLIKKSLFSPKPPVPDRPAFHSAIERILELARWAPSGDNTQPWRFEIRGDKHLIIQATPAPSDGVYNLDNTSFYFALGCLLETIAIAATAEKLIMHWTLQELPVGCTIDIHFDQQEKLESDPLLPYIPIRSVQRRSLRTRALTLHEKHKLQQSVGPQYKVLFLEGFWNRIHAARLLGLIAKIRLLMPEAFPTHQHVIDWNSRFSPTKIPDHRLRPLILC